MFLLYIFAMYSLRLSIAGLYVKFEKSAMIFRELYDILRKLPPLDRYRKGVYIMNLFGSFIVSVAASIVAYYICRWLSGDRER